MFFRPRSSSLSDGDVWAETTYLPIDLFIYPMKHGPEDNFDIPQITTNNTLPASSGEKYGAPKKRMFFLQRTTRCHPLQTHKHSNVSGLSANSPVVCS